MMVDFVEEIKIERRAQQKGLTFSSSGSSTTSSITIVQTSTVLTTSILTQIPGHPKTIRFYFKKHCENESFHCRLLLRIIDAEK
jgi:hypothetical protein